MENQNKPINILLIEDNPGDARLITEYLSPAGAARFKVTVAGRLESGKSLLDAETFDVVLLDLNLPDSDGLDTFERLHAHAPSVPVIVLTGLDSDDIGIAALKEGAQDYMFKGDADRSTLVRSIRHSIERARLESQILLANQSLEERVKLRTEELEAERERASRSEKLAMIGQLSGGIAHDLRNPLSAISNAAYYLKRKFNAGEPRVNIEAVSEWVELISSEVNRANGIITDLLSHGANKQMAFSDVQIGNVIQDSLASFVLNDNIVLSITTAPNLPLVLGDPPQLTRVLQNLVANAQDAMERGGCLSITAQRAEGFVEIVVTDTGSGIQSKSIDKIFEPLFSEKTHGTGLGLAICHEIIDKHAGNISVKSKVGTGTSFTVLIPIAVGDKAALAA